MMRTTGVMAVALGLVVVLMLCGCSLGTTTDADGNVVSGSYDGRSATLNTQKATITLTDITADFEASKASGTFHFWANQENHGAIEMTGSYSISGSTVTVTAAPAVDSSAQKGTDAITMSLNIESGTQLGGSMNYTQDSLTYGGDVDFTRYENQ